MILNAATDKTGYEEPGKNQCIIKKKERASYPKNRMKIAVVTGASSGLGKEFVKEIARKEKIEEIWVIARREDRLKSLSENLSVPVKIFPLDLTDQKSFDVLEERLQKEKPDVRILVNAAGFGKMGNYKEISRQDQNNMIELNCRALMNLSVLMIPWMSRGSRIIEICSVAAFQPLPSLNVYAATKAFAQSYSKALRWELFGTGIHVTAVCPYWISDTEFIPVTRENTGNKKAVRHFPLAQKSGEVAGHSLFWSKLNVPVCTPGLASFLMRFFTKFIPNELITACWELLRRI